MRVPARWLLAGVAFASALFGVAGPARAERTIALLEIEGARSEDMRKSIGKLLTDDVRIISIKTYERAAKRLHAEKLNTGDVRKVCDYLETDGIIDGTLVAEDDGYKLVLRLREGSSGRIAWRQRITLKSPELGTKLKPELKRRLMREIDDLEPIDEEARAATAKSNDDDDDDEAAEEEAPKKTKKQLRAEARAAKKAEKDRKREEAAEAAAAARAAKEEEDRAEQEERAARKKRKAAREREDDEEDEPKAVDVEDDDEEEETARKSRKTKTNDDEDEEENEEGEGGEDDKKVATADEDEDEVEEDDKGDDPLLTKGFDDKDGRAGADLRERAIVINLGASVIARRLKFNFDSSLPAAQSPLPYKGAPVPGIYLAGELYPAAFGGGPSSVFKNIGIGFVFDRVFKLNSKIESADGDELAEVSTTQQRFGASLRYRHNFGNSPASPTLYASVGYNRSQFELAKDEVDEMITIPNTTYSYIDPGLGVRFGIGDAFGILAEGRGVLVLDAGEIQEPEQYGAATITGFDADLAAEYWITSNVVARLGGHMFYLGYDFKENTGTLQDPDGDGEVDVGGARDVWFGGFLTVGYAY